MENKIYTILKTPERVKFYYALYETLDADGDDVFEGPLFDTVLKMRRLIRNRRIGLNRIIKELAAGCDRWMAENPGDYPYARLVENMFGCDSRGAHELVNREYMRTYRPVIFWTGMEVTPKKSLVGRLRRQYCRFEAREQDTVCLCRRPPLTKESMRVTELPWPDMWRALNYESKRYVGVVEFLTKYCDVRPLENKEVNTEENK